MSDHISDSYLGSRKVTCYEAAKLLRENIAIKVFFRPDGLINHDNSDNDTAYVWEDKDALFEENNSGSI